MKSSFRLLIAVIIWGVVMTLSARYQVSPEANIAGIKQAPGVAMQFAHSNDDLKLLDGGGEQQSKANRRMVRKEQYLDFVFIALYWSFFFFAIAGTMTSSAARYGLRLLISIAAILDVLENLAILSITAQSPHWMVWPFWFAFSKWLLIFLSLAVSSTLFLFYPRQGIFAPPSCWSVWLARVFGGLYFLFAVIGVIGVLKVLAAKGALLNVGIMLLFASFVLLLIFFLQVSGVFASFRNNFLSWSTYLYALRFPILGCLFLILFPVLDMRSGGFAAISRGILSLEHYVELFFAAWLVTGTAWVAMIVSRIILAYGEERFGIAPPPEWRITSQMSWRTFFLWSAPSWPLLARLVLLLDIDSRSWLAVAAAVILGVVVAIAVLWVTEWIHLHEKDPQSPLDHALILPLVAPLRRAHKAAPFQRGSLFKPLLSRLGPGYVENSRLHSGHTLAAVLVLLTLLLYLIGYRVLMPRPESGTAYFPVICYIMVLLIIFLWSIGGFSFFADRFRLPVLTLIVVYSMVFNFACSLTPRDADHYFDIQKAESVTRLTPKEVVERWQRDHAGDSVPMVVVTATGGGIQAAAWTAQVLTGLHKDLHSCGKDFGRSIALISSVSGGSVGSMYFAENLAETLPQQPATPGGSCGPFSVTEAANRSSLREAAWGLAYPDLLRTVLPFAVNRTKDRGWALEQAWRRCWSGAKFRMQRDWVRSVNDDQMPAVILNATTAESGQRFLLTNFQTPDTKSIDNPQSPQNPPANGLLAKGDVPDLLPTPSFTSLYPGNDIDLTTAARLSATFTYVTPMAKALLPGRRTYHMADGGYFDNYGVSSAVEWLLEAFPSAKVPKPTEDPKGKQKKKRWLLFLEIEASAKPDASTPVDAEERLAAKSSWDWIDQLEAPITTMLHVRTSGQAERNEVTLKMLSDHPPDGFEFHRVIVDFHNPNPPLSWHLTKSQKDDIVNNWESKLQAGRRQEVRSLFGCQLP